MTPDFHGDMGRARLELDAAKAFQAGWSIARFLTGEVHPVAVDTELTALLGALDVELRSPVGDYLDREGDALSRLLNEAGAQLKVRRPGLLPYFQAGWNIPFDLAGNGGQRLEEIAKTIELPAALADPQDASRPWDWANAVATSFHERIYGGAAPRV